MATKTQLLNQIISYGVQNKKRKDDIMQAILKSGQFDVGTSATALKTLQDMGTFDYEQNQNPLDVNQKNLTGVQNTALGFGRRTLESGKIISGLENNIANKSGWESLKQRGEEWAVGGTTTNALVSKEFQQFDQAKRNFINATLRRESGAVISPEEFENATIQYFPIPGDKPENVEQKRKNREMITQNLLGEAGIDVKKVNLNDLGATEQPQNQDALKKFNATLNYAQKNPQDPKSQQFLQMIKEGKIDPTTGQLVEQGNQHNQTAMPVAKTASQEQPQDDKFLNRLWNATKEVVPELGSDIGKRLKNIWGNIQQGQEQVRQGQSFFDSIINTQRQQLRNVGEVAGGVTDVAKRALELAYKAGVPEDTKKQIKDKATEFLNTPTGQSALGALQQGTDAWDKFKEQSPEVAKDLEASFNIVTAMPAAYGLKAVGKEGGAIISDASKLTGIGRDIEKSASNQIFRAVKPTITTGRNKAAVRDTLNLANRELLERGSNPTNFKEYTEALTNAKQSVWQEVESKLNSAGKGDTVDLSGIAQKLKDLAGSPTLLRSDRTASARIQKMAESLTSQGKKIGVQDAEKLKQYLNSELSGAFGKFKYSNAEQNAKKMMTAEIGKQLDEILSNIPGEFSGLKKKYGALREIEEDALKRLIVFERQNPQGLVDSFSKISGVGNILKGIMTASPADIAKGAGEIALGQIQKKANDADAIIKKVFEKLHKGREGFKSKTFNYLKDNPPGLTTKNVSGGESLLQEARGKSLDEFLKAKLPVMTSVDDLQMVLAKKYGVDGSFEKYRYQTDSDNQLLKLIENKSGKPANDIIAEAKKLQTETSSKTKSQLTSIWKEANKGVAPNESVF